MSLDDAARLFVLLAVLNIVCTSVLLRGAWRNRDLTALVDRAFVGAVLALVAIGGGWLGLSQLGIWTLSRPAVLAILIGTMVLVTLPSVVWVVQYWRGRFS